MTSMLPFDSTGWSLIYSFHPRLHEYASPTEAIAPNALCSWIDWIPKVIWPVDYVNELNGLNENKFWHWVRQSKSAVNLSLTRILRTYNLISDLWKFYIRLQILKRIENLFSEQIFPHIFITNFRDLLSMFNMLKHIEKKLFCINAYIAYFGTFGYFANKCISTTIFGRWAVESQLTVLTKLTWLIKI